MKIKNYAEIKNLVDDRRLSEIALTILCEIGKITIESKQNGFIIEVKNEKIYYRGSPIRNTDTSEIVKMFVTLLKEKLISKKAEIEKELEVL